MSTDTLKQIARKIFIDFNIDVEYSGDFDKFFEEYFSEYIAQVNENQTT